MGRESVQASTHMFACIGLLRRQLKHNRAWHSNDLAFMEEREKTKNASAHALAIGSAQDL